LIDNREDFLAAMDEAVQKGGGIVAFARRMGVTHQAIYHWRRRGWAPVERAVAIEAVFGIDRNRLMEPSLAQALSSPRAGE
jgi:transposase-like protein